MKINVIEIVTQHFGTLRNAAKNKCSVTDIAFFYGIPAIVAVFLLYLGYHLNDNIIGVLLAAFSILTGFLFNLLVFLVNMVEKTYEVSQGKYDSNKLSKHEVKKVLLKETYYNISYCVLMGLVLTAVLVVGLVECRWVNVPMSFLVYYIITHFMLTLLMVLKRFNSLLSNEIKRSTS